MSSANEVHPLDLLSEELWEAIVDLLEDAQDWRSLSTTCSTFVGIVGFSRLFLNVLPHVIQFLETSDVLIARGVCQRWKNAVDTMAEDVMTTRHPSPPHFEAFLLMHHITFYSGHQMDEFFEDMETHTGNPFIGKTVGFRVHTVEGWGEDEIDGRIVPFTNITRFLERFGRHIRKLIFNGLTDGLDDPIEGVGRFVQFLRLVPNVKNIDMEYKQSWGLTDGARRAAVIPQIVNVTPILSDLESLTFTTSDLDVEVVEYFLNCIHSMCLSPQKVTYLLISPISENMNIFPNIREFIDVMEASRQFAFLNGCRWPLEILYTIGPSDSLRSDMVFPVVERFAETLTHLRLGSPELVVEDGASLNLPNLKSLQLEWIRSSSLDFLNELPSGCEVVMDGVGLIDWIQHWNDEDERVI